MGLAISLIMTQIVVLIVVIKLVKLNRKLDKVVGFLMKKELAAFEKVAIDFAKSLLDKSEKNVEKSKIKKNNVAGVNKNKHKN